MSVLMNLHNTPSSRTKKQNSSIEEAEFEEAAVPDSTTTIEKDRPEFSNGQDVLLVNHKDGCYYLGTVVEVDVIREQCLVKFGDNTESWSSFKDLTKLSSQFEQDLLCVVCKKSAPKDKHEIAVCDKCGRGYHQKCHQPEIPVESLKDGCSWICWRCTDHFPVRTTRNLTFSESCKRKRNSSLDAGPVLPTDRSKLPYDLDTLTWDTYHRVNNEQIYCYCGKAGEWYSQMLQCGRCRQWFHEKCIRCLRFPLYCGDRFYVFVCSICNFGKEFVRRLELKWVDLVHLMLFNLTAFNVKKYYDLDTVIIPYVNDNWHALQLPPKIYDVSKSERRENILSILTNNRNRFKCGREIKKRTTIWGLRLRLPPPAPCVTLPSTGPITEELLKERWQGNRRLQFLPYQQQSDHKVYNNGAKTDHTPMIVPVDPTMMGLMRGLAYQHENNVSETESPSPSPTTITEDTQLKLYKMDYEGGGFVKKSVPFPKISLQRRKRLLSMNVRERDKLLRRQKRKAAAGKKMEEQSVGVSTRIQRSAKRLSLDSAETKRSIDLPLTPPTSVSAPPTPPASNTSAQRSEGAADFSSELAQNLNNLSANMGKTKLTRSNLSATGLDINLNTPCDTSGDETSSKSTLDLIIPPPKDFEGKNNPFHALLRDSGKRSKDKKKRLSNKEEMLTTTPPPPPITLPLPLTAVIPGRPIARPLKRQLSEKDICIGPNGEVKRRRLRRGRPSQIPASKTATIVPTRPDMKEWSQRNLRSGQPNNAQSQIGNCVDYALNGRRLRQRQEKGPELSRGDKSASTTPKPSPVKQEPDINMDDLKTSVNMYFGAANRIANGEPFTIKAKRVGPTGKTQYLIEWDAPVGMT